MGFIDRLEQKLKVLQDERIVAQQKAQDQKVAEEEAKRQAEADVLSQKEAFDKRVAALTAQCEIFLFESGIPLMLERLRNVLNDDKVEQRGFYGIPSEDGSTSVSYRMLVPRRGADIYRVPPLYRDDAQISIRYPESLAMILRWNLRSRNKDKTLRREGRSEFREHRQETEFTYIVTEITPEGNLIFQSPVMVLGQPTSFRRTSLLELDEWSNKKERVEIELEKSFTHPFYYKSVSYTQSWYTPPPGIVGNS